MVKTQVSTFIEPSEDFDLRPDALVALCIEGGARGLLLDTPSLPAAFFDLATGIAGELLHGLSKYGLRLAAVVPDMDSHSDTFRAFCLESNRGSQFRFFETRAAAISWLESHGAG